MRSAILALLAVAALALAACAQGQQQQEQAQAVVCPAQAEIDAAPLRVRRGEAGALDGFLAAAPCHHWLTFYFAAERLFADGRRDEAVRWFYAAQLRGRIVANLDTNGAAAQVVDGLQYVVGQPINEYAGADVRKWAEAAQWALDWDAAHPLRIEQAVSIGNMMDFSGQTPLQFVPVSPRATPERFAAAYAENREGLGAMRAAIAALNQDEVDAMRRQNGLE